MRSNDEFKVWMAAVYAQSPRVAVLCALECVRSVLHLLPPEEEKPLKVLDGVDGWLRGEVSKEECEIFGDASYVAAVDYRRSNGMVGAVCMSAKHLSHAVYGIDDYSRLHGATYACLTAAVALEKSGITGEVALQRIETLARTRLLLVTLNR